MHRWSAGVLALLLLGGPALRADDPPAKPDKPPTPAEQFKALQKENLEAQQAFQKKLREAKPDERAKLFEQNPVRELAPKFLGLAEKHPKDPVALDALIWVMQNTSRPGESRELRAKAVEAIVRDHIASPKLAAVCQNMAFGFDRANDAFLKAVIAKSPNAEVRAEAQLAFAQSAAQRANIVKRMADDPDLVKRIESALPKELANDLKAAKLDAVEAESQQRFRDLAEKHLAALPLPRIMALCQSLRFSGGPGGDFLLRTLLDKDQRADVQGAACLTLAQSLKQRADDLPEAKAAEADKLRAESEKLFERAVEKYADVKFGRGTVGKVAKQELFDIRHLAVGKQAPAVEGEDQDGQKFKLSDYHGKVVMLDFWNEF